MTDITEDIVVILVAVVAALLIAAAGALWVNAFEPMQLASRPLTEIDIQGHQAGTPGDMCPGQYTYRLVDSTPLYCWGKR